MNSYNENLQASVISSLNAQELDLKNASAQLNAAMFSLYYAQEARITAAENVEASAVKYADAQKLENAAVLNNNVTVNLVDAATQSKNNTDQAINNSAVAASNVQVAANAILLLASDLGGILNIASAADFDTQIYDQADDASGFIKDTSYEAEVATQYAMEAANLNAQVSSSTVLDESKAVGTSMKTLKDTLTSQFNTASDTLAADSTALSTASESEKKAEGILEDTNVEYYATEKAYASTSYQLNLGISVPDGTTKVDGTDQQDKTNTYYTVFFEPLKAAYTPESEENTGYPVKEYYLFLVPYDESATFSISAAEALIDEGKVRSYHKVASEALPVGSTFYEEKIYISNLLDVNQNDLNLGDSYTIFVYAEFTKPYQRALNNYDNYLSAPSKEFSIVNKIDAPAATNITGAPAPLVLDTTDPDTVSPTEITNTINFSVNVPEYYFKEVVTDGKSSWEIGIEYRLMLLPDQRSVVQGLLTAEGLRQLETEVQQLEYIADIYDPQIVALTDQINSLEASISALELQQAELMDELENPTPETDTKAVQAQLTAINLELYGKDGTEAKPVEPSKYYELNAAVASLSDTEQKKEEAMSGIDPNFDSKPGFFFNALLADQVPAGSYMNPTTLNYPKTANKKGTRKVIGSFKFDDTMIDNFGNLLVAGDIYIPAIYAKIKDDNPSPDQYESELSDFANTGHFTYQH